MEFVKFRLDPVHRHAFVILDGVVSLDILALQMDLVMFILKHSIINFMIFKALVNFGIV
jgi:hypothetical protein